MNIDHAIPTRASEILISKICHDLVSPVGAVNNGIEFLNDMGADGLQDGLGLIEHSAKQASVRLQLFRMCYGAGGSDSKTTGKMVYETFQNFVAGTKVSMQWDLMNDMPDCDLPAGFMKTLLNAMVFVGEAIPKGGVVSVAMVDGAMVVSGSGDLIKPKDGAIDGLNGSISMDELSPKSIHGFITHSYSDLFGLSLSHSCDDQVVKIEIKIP
jgi:histidine phosphotransferase ChpT